MDDDERIVCPVCNKSVIEDEYLACSTCGQDMCLYCFEEEACPEHAIPYGDSFWDSYDDPYCTDNWRE